MAQVEVIRAFSEASESYEQNASVQRECAQDLLEMLHTDAAARILDIGCGTGMFTRMLAEKFPQAQILACDPSYKMILEAKRLNVCPSISFEQRSLADLPSERWDLIASNAALHWAGDPADVLADLKGRLTENGTVAFSYFTNKTYSELAQALSQASGTETKLASAQFASADEVEAALLEQFSDVRLQRKVYTRDFENLRALLQHIKLTGTRGGGASPKQRWTRKLLALTEKEYLARFGAIRASYEVVLCTARKPSI